MPLEISAKDIKEVEEKSIQEEFSYWLEQCPVDWECIASAEDPSGTVFERYCLSSRKKKRNYA
jgi:hypothetical protein